MICEHFYFRFLEYELARKKWVRTLLVPKLVYGGQWIRSEYNFVYVWNLLWFPVGPCDFTVRNNFSWSQMAACCKFWKITSWLGLQKERFLVNRIEWTYCMRCVHYNFVVSFCSMPPITLFIIKCITLTWFFYLFSFVRLYILPLLSITKPFIWFPSASCLLDISSYI